MDDRRSRRLGGALACYGSTEPKQYPTKGRESEVVGCPKLSDRWARPLALSQGSGARGSWGTSTCLSRSSIPGSRCSTTGSRCDGDYAVEVLHRGSAGTEGPVYVPAGRYLVWSDIPNDRMLRWDEITGAVGVFREPSGFTNGNTLDRRAA